MIELNYLNVRYGELIALNSVSICFDSEKTTVLIGPSGCGKSTILKSIIGLTKKESGSVTVDQKPITDENLYEYRRKMGYVIQEGGLFPHLTAEENISIMAKQIAWSDKKVKGRIESLCDLTKLHYSVLKRYPAQLSGGQRQRVSLMRALMLDPDILLLDEPLGALDPIIRFELQNDLRDIFKSLKKTVVFVTHDMGEAAFFGDKIVLMKDAEVVQKGTIMDLVKKPSSPFVSEFINAQRSPLESVQ